MWRRPCSNWTACLGILTTVLLVAPIAWADPPEGKGKGNAPGQQNPGNNGNNGNGNAGNNGGGNANSNAGGNSGGNARSAAGGNADRGNSVADSVRAERTHVHAERANDRAADRESAAGQSRAEHASVRPSVTSRDRQANRSERTTRGKDRALQVAGLLTNLSALHGKDHAQWWKHPTDTRGQGNAGKVLMQNPFGHDKDSGREGRDRGRPMQETTKTVELLSFNVADAITIDWQMNGYLQYLYFTKTWIGTVDPSYELLIDDLITDAESRSNEWLEVNSDHTINYTMALTAPDGSEGTTLSITTELIALEDLSAAVYTWTDEGEMSTSWVSYSAGSAVLSSTDQVTLGTDSTYSFNYDPPDYLAGYDDSSVRGTNYQLQITVTEPVSGTSYTVTYDTPLYLYRCPYGVVYDHKTRQPIAGATVTVHDATTGAIIALDKGANPHQSNPQTTDATGRYDAKLQIGRQYYLTVQAPGYSEYQSPTFSERWHVVREDIPLQAVQKVVKK